MRFHPSDPGVGFDIRDDAAELRAQEGAHRRQQARCLRLRKGNHHGGATTQDFRQQRERTDTKTDVDRVAVAEGSGGH